MLSATHLVAQSTTTINGLGWHYTALRERTPRRSWAGGRPMPEDGLKSLPTAEVGLAATSAALGRSRVNRDLRHRNFVERRES